jgi:hypothetical protein
VNAERLAQIRRLCQESHQRLSPERAFALRTAVEDLLSHIAGLEDDIASLQNEVDGEVDRMKEYAARG